MKGRFMRSLRYPARLISLALLILGIVAAVSAQDNSINPYPAVAGEDRRIRHFPGMGLLSSYSSCVSYWWSWITGLSSASMRLGRCVFFRVRLFLEQLRPCRTKSLLRLLQLCERAVGFVAHLRSLSSCRPIAQPARVHFDAGALCPFRRRRRGLILAVELRVQQHRRPHKLLSSILRYCSPLPSLSDLSDSRGRITALLLAASACGRPSDARACGSSPARKTASWLPSPPATASGSFCTERERYPSNRWLRCPSSPSEPAERVQTIAGGFQQRDGAGLVPGSHCACSLDDPLRWPPWP